MYLCIVYVMGDPQEEEGNFVSEVCSFNTLDEARHFEHEVSDFYVYVDIYEAKRI